MRIRRLIAAAVVVAATLGSVAPTLAAGSPVAGTFTLADHGQGGWAGGPLYADGTAGGGGGVSFSTPDGQFVQVIHATSWSFDSADHSTIQLCFSTKGLQNAPSGPFCFDHLPVTGGPIVVSEGPGDITTIRVSFH